MYEAVKREGIVLEPDSFLANIYKQIPVKLISKRETEINQANNPNDYSERVGVDALPRMVAIAHVLQPA